MIRSTTTFDFFRHKTVPVIVAFNENGDIKPLYVNINNTVYRIACYKIISEEFCPVLRFYCKVEDGNEQKPLVLEYHPSEKIWILPKYRIPH